MFGFRRSIASVRSYTLPRPLRGLDIRVRNEKIDCHRFSGIASQRVEWVDPNIEQVKREAPSLSFLQEKQKHLE